MYSEFLGIHQKLIFCYGDNILCNTILEKFNEMDTFKMNNYHFFFANEIKIEAKKEKKPPSEPEGLIKHNWVKNLTTFHPSLVLFTLDWSVSIPGIEWKDKENALLLEFNKFKENLRSRNIKIVLILFLGKNMNFSANLPEREGGLRKLLELDSKQLHIIYGGIETFAQHTKKLQKTIEETSQFYYQEYLKKTKKKIVKTVDIFSLEINLKGHFQGGFLYEILKKPDKALKQYLKAYQIIDQLQKYYYNAAANSIKENDLDSISSNFIKIQKNEELRYLSDVIHLRMMQIKLISGSENDLLDCFNLFDNHYKQNKQRVLYFSNLLLFEENKWKANLFKIFGYLIQSHLQSSQSAMSLDIEKTIQIKLINLFLSSISENNSRIENLKANYQNAVEIMMEGIVLQKLSPIYFGREYFRVVKESDILNPLEKNSTDPKKMSKGIISFRVKGEQEAAIREENISILKGLETSFPFYKRQLILIQHAQLKNYFKLKKYSEFKYLAEALLLILQKSQWNALSEDIYEDFEFLASELDQDNDLLKLNYSLLFFKPESSTIKENRFSNLMHLFQKKLTAEVNQFLPLNNTIFKAKISLNTTSCLYNSFFTFEITLDSAFNWLHKVVSKIRVSFNEELYNLEIPLTSLKQNNCQYTSQFSQRLDRSISGSQLIFESVRIYSIFNAINFSWELSPKDLIFTNSNLISVIPEKDSIELEIIKTDPTMLGETSSLTLNILPKVENEEKLSDLEIRLFDYEIGSFISKPDQPIITSVTTSISYLCENSEEKKEQPIKLAELFEQTRFKFLLKIKEEGEKVFTILIVYSFTKQGRTITRELAKKFSLRVEQPFFYVCKPKINNHFLNFVFQPQLQNTRQNLSMPANEICCLQSVLSPLHTDIIIKKIKYEKMSDKIDCIRIPEENMSLLLEKGENYSFDIFLKTKSPKEDISLGNFSVTWKRDKSEIELFNTTIFSLPQANVEQYGFQVELIVHSCYNFGETFEIGVEICNFTSKNHHFLITMLENKDFLVAGTVRKTFSIKTDEKFIFKYFLLPKNIGKLKIPTVLINCITMENKVIFDSSGSKIVTILPKNE